MSNPEEILARSHADAGFGADTCSEADYAVARQQIAALNRAGFAIVPVKPTEAMREAKNQAVIRAAAAGKERTNAW